MPMCPRDISTGTPWKKFQFESGPGQKISRNMDCKKKACVFVVWLDMGGVAIALPFVILLVRPLVYQRLLGTNDKSIKKHRKIQENCTLPEKN